VSGFCPIQALSAESGPGAVFVWRPRMAVWPSKVTSVKKFPVSDAFTLNKNPACFCSVAKPPSLKMSGSHGSAS
jgi:hypothetical protein